MHDSEGHKGEDCTMRVKGDFCRVCGDDYHASKNCTKSKVKCSKCNANNSHNVALHNIKDMT